MKRLIGALVFLVLGACEAPREDAQETLDGDEDKASYGVGYEVGSSVAAQFQGMLNADAFVAGVEDAMAERESRISDEEKLAAINMLNERVRARDRSTASDNREAGAAFLLENGRRDDVVTLPSGLQYQIIEAGEGPSPGPSDRVTTHYHGTLIDGTVFDSSVQRGEPVAFPVDGVIAGWTEALQLMRVGSKWRLFIPPALAYGERGAGPSIGPNSTLIFDVELIAID